jgi:hypothetical protein
MIIFVKNTTMEKTAVQQVFSELENLHPHLFNIYSTEGREFVNHFHKFLEIEKKQITDSFKEGTKYIDINDEISAEFNAIIYYNETFNK